jgi:hypothetical protein
MLCNVPEFWLLSRFKWQIGSSVILGSVDYSWTAWPLKMKPIGFSETSITTYQSMLRRGPVYAVWWIRISVLKKFLPPHHIYMSNGSLFFDWNEATSHVRRVIILFFNNHRHWSPWWGLLSTVRNFRCSEKLRWIFLPEKLLPSLARIWL